MEAPGGITDVSAPHTRLRACSSANGGGEVEMLLEGRQAGFKIFLKYMAAVCVFYRMYLKALISVMLFACAKCRWPA